MVGVQGGKIEAVCNSMARCEVVWTGFAAAAGDAGGADYDVGGAGGESVIARLIPRRAIGEPGQRGPSTPNLQLPTPQGIITTDHTLLGVGIWELGADRFFQQLAASMLLRRRVTGEAARSFRDVFLAGTQA